MDHPEAEAAVRERDDLVPTPLTSGVASCVGDDHDLELEALRAVDREQADRVGPLLLGERLELLRAERLLVLDEAHEGGEVGAADGLVLPREAPELPQVREPARSVPARENREVVVVLGEDLLAQPLEPGARGQSDEALVALEECAQQLLLLDRGGPRGTRARAR